MHQFYFEKLDVWQNARVLSKEVHIMTANFPSDEKFGLTWLIGMNYKQKKLIIDTVKKIKKK